MIIDREKVALLTSIDEGVIINEAEGGTYEVWFPSILAAACFRENVTACPRSEPYASHVRLMEPVHDFDQGVVVRVLINERYR